MELSLPSVSPTSAAPELRARARSGARPSAASARPDDATMPNDVVTLSGEAQEKASGATRAGVKAEPTAEQQRELTELQQRDTHVRQHEAAHQAAGGALAGGASFTYQLGPDGKSYAIGGEVPVRMQSGRTPEESIANARRVRAAALAPSDPSAQDLAVAAAATSMEMAAQAQKAREAAKAYRKQTAAAKNGEPSAEAQRGPAQQASDEGSSAYL